MSPDRPARRAVITGIGMVTPCGLDRESTWEAVCAGRSGIGPVSRFDVSAFPSKIAGEVRGFDPSSVVPRRETTTLDRFQLYALAAALEAAADAGLDVGRVGPERVGVVFGVGLGGIESMERSHLRLLERGPRLVSPFLVPMMIPNMAASHISLRLGAKGPCEVVTTACASGAHALAAALRWIRDGLVDVVVAGGAEAAVTPLSLGGFCAMRALSTRYNDRPTEASRPFDAARDGFVLAEGAAAVVLEARDRRDLQGYAELAGSASTSDAHHITQPDPEGRGQARCLALALADAGLAPEELDLINAHGTSTAQNDPAEAAAIIKVLGTERARTVRVNATKSMTGHMLGAAGAVEAALCALTLSRGIIPPTLNLENPDQACNLGHVIGQALKTEVRTAASNSFGFGGTNATLVLTKSS